jgi:microcin C transport system substrate-binding protein
VPHWYRATHPIAYWDEYDHPTTLPRYSIENYATNVGERILWWYDAAKAAKLESAK